MKKSFFEYVVQLMIRMFCLRTVVQENGSMADQTHIVVSCKGGFFEWLRE